MVKLKRYCIKYIRDRAKSGYVKDDKCFICNEFDDLDFHHFYTLTLLLKRWRLKNKVEDEDILEWRDVFIAQHSPELYEHAVTLCHIHHMKLHSIYGKNPNLGTAKKQARWVNIQREKHEKNIINNRTTFI